MTVGITVGRKIGGNSTAAHAWIETGRPVRASAVGRKPRTILEPLLTVEEWHRE